MTLVFSSHSKVHWFSKNTNSFDRNVQEFSFSKFSVPMQKSIDFEKNTNSFDRNLQEFSFSKISVPIQKSIDFRKNTKSFGRNTFFFDRNAQRFSFSKHPTKFQDTSKLKLMIRKETVWITRVQTPASQDKTLPPIGEYHSLALSHFHIIIINTYNEHLYGFPVRNLLFRWLGIGVCRQSFSINRAL